MLLIPQGLVTKTRRLPLATMIVAVCTSFFSLLHFEVIKEANQVFWQNPVRVQYAQQAKAFVQAKCNKEQAMTFCVGLDQVSLQDYLWPKTLDFLLNKGPEATILANTIGYIADELNPKKLANENQALYALQVRAQQVNQNYTKEKDLLSRQNVSFLSALRAVFIHVNIFHLFFSVVLLFFVAFPVEERMGGFFFLVTYGVSGMVGLMGQAFLDPLNFYIVGSTAAICGISGALFTMFWKHQAKLNLNFLFIKSKSIYFPVSLYAPIFLVGCLVIHFMLPFHSISYIAHFGGFFVGGLMGYLYKMARPLPENFTYPYELDFYKKAQANLSQTDRVQVFAEWLYYSPTNKFAFRELAKEVTRSSTNPKVNKILNKFREYAFPEIYRLNRKDVEFLTLLPVRWLSWVSVGHSKNFLTTNAERFAEERNFELAFKFYFLAMNEVGWKDGDEAIELFKNFKKATINDHFVQESNVLKDRHSPFQRFLSKRDGFAVA